MWSEAVGLDSLPSSLFPRSVYITGRYITGRDDGHFHINRKVEAARIGKSILLHGQGRGSLPGELLVSLSMFEDLSD